MKKTANYLIFISLIIIYASCSVSKKSVLESDKYKKLKTNIETHNYVFQPNYIIPSGEIQSKYLSPGYFITFTNNEIVVNLPFLGMSTSTNYDGRLIGYDFTSKKYIYNIKTDKKNNWLIDVKFKDYKENLEMTMKITPNGKANITLVSFSRQQITFTGKIE